MVSKKTEPPRKRRSGDRSPAEEPSTPGAAAFGTVLRRLREAAGFTQVELAGRTGLSVEAISNLERGVNQQPRKGTIQLLAGALTSSPRARAAFEAAAGFPASQEENAPPGRSSEWAWLRYGLEDARPLLALTGEPGIGKSYLLDALEPWARANGWQVLRGNCHSGSGQEPYSPLAEAIKTSVHALPQATKGAALNGCAWLTRLLPELAEDGTLPAPLHGLSPEQERRLMFDAIDRYLEHICAQASILIILDDVQWSGEDTIRLLAHVIRCIGARPIRVLVAYRSTEVQRGHPLSRLMGAVAKDDRVVRWQLAPLAPDDATHLARILLRTLLRQPSAGAGRALAQRLVVRLVERAGGVPFFLVSYARWLQSLALERGPQATAEDSIGLSIADLDRIPSNVAEYVQLQVAALSPAAQALLESAAVAVNATASDVLAECVGQSEWEAVADLELACAAGLLKEGEADDGRVTYRCAHDLLREAVEGDLRPGRRALLHKALGEALERRLEGCESRRDALIPRIAYHFASTAEHEKAALYLWQAGDQARKAYAHQESARSYRGVAAHLDALGRERDAADARQNLAAELAHRGRYAEALAALERAEADYRALGEIESRAAVVATMASIHATRGTGKAGLARLRPFVEALTGSDASAAAVSPVTSAELLGTLSHLDFMAGHYEEALRSGERAVEIARATGNELLLAKARVALGVALLTLGRLAESGEELDWAIAAAEAAGDDPDSLSLVMEARLMAIWTAMTRGNFARSGELVEQALKVAQRLNNLVTLGHALFFHALLAYYIGDWAEARRLGGLAAGTLGEPDSTQIGSYPLLGLGWLSLVEGRRKEALPLLEESGKIARRSEGEQVLRLIEALLAEDELVAQRGDKAYDRLVPLLTAQSLQARTRVELSILRAWGALQMGALAEAEEMALRCVRDARVHDMRLFLPDALRVRALCAIQRGAWPEAKEALEEALRVCRKMPYPYAEAKALYAYGELCLRMGEPGSAREHFGEALAICNQLGERMYGAAIERALAKAAEVVEIERR